MASMTAMLAMASSSGDGDVRVFEDGAGEGVALQGVLIADGEGLQW